MASVAVTQLTGDEVEDTAEESDEHAVLVLFGHRVIHVGNNLGGTVLAAGDGAEEALGYRHHQCRRHTLTGNIANTEEELLIANVEIVKVATHLLGGDDAGGNVEVGAFGEGGEGLGDERHLYVATDAKLVLNQFLLGVKFLVFQLVFSNETEDDDYQHNTEYLQDFHHHTHSADTSEEVFLRDDDREGPARTFHRGSVDQSVQIVRLLSLKVGT